MYIVDYCLWSGPSWPILEVMRAQHTVPSENQQGAWQNETQLWSDSWQVPLEQTYMFYFPLLGRSPPCSGEMREPIRGHCGQVRLTDRSHQEGIVSKLTFKLTSGYGVGGTNQVTVTNVLVFLFINLYKSFTIRLNKWTSWLIPVHLPSLVVFCGASVTSP